MLKLCNFAVILLVCRSACALPSGPWDGVWFLDPSASRRPHEIQVSLLSEGTWRFFDGVEDRTFGVEDNTHRAGTPAMQRRASSPDPQTLLFSESIHGREHESYTLSLSADGVTLTCTAQRRRWDGELRKRSLTYTRGTPGKTLQGSWHEVEASASQNLSSPQPATAASPQPAWVIWSGTDGIMTWFIPNTGETLRGKADMKLREIQGPYYDGTFFSWKQTSPTRLEFTAYVDGRPKEYAVETLSADRQTFTDTLWAAGHEDSKTIRVFHKQP